MDIEKEIAELVKRNFKLTSVPVPVIREFKAYCDAECGGTYAVGLLQLLKTKQMYENLIPLISQLIDEVAEVKSQAQTQPTKSRRTFADE